MLFFFFSCPLYSHARRRRATLSKHAVESPHGEVVRANIVLAFEGESKCGPCYRRTVMKEHIRVYEICIGPFMLLRV